MNKNELAQKVAGAAGLAERDVEKVINSAVDIITETIKSGEEVMLTGFGVFSSKIRHARNGVNPLNPSEKIHIPEVLVAKFKAGKALKDALKNKEKLEKTKQESMPSEPSPESENSSADSSPDTSAETPSEAPEKIETEANQEPESKESAEE